MSARPVLALVPTTPRRVGRAALHFIQWAVDTFGRPCPEPGRVVVHRSQTALVAEHETIRSDGTVTRYMRQLRDAGIVIAVRPITVDLHALADIAGEASADRAVSPIPAGGGDAPTAPMVVELLVRRAEQHARLAQLQAELALTDVALARAVSDIGPADADPAARDLANQTPANRDRDRELRDPQLAIQEGRKEYLNNPPSFLTSDIASRDPETRERSRSRDPLPTAEQALTYNEVDEILEPLRAWCRAAGLIDHLDDQGRDLLSPLGRGQLTAGAERIRLEAGSDPTIRKPIGLLIARALSGHSDTFQPPPDLDRPPWTTTPATTSATTTVQVEPLFEPCVSRPLDQEVIALASSPAGLSTARRSLRPTTVTSGHETYS